MIAFWGISAKKIDCAKRIAFFRIPTSDSCPAAQDSLTRTNFGANLSILKPFENAPLSPLFFDFDAGRREITQNVLNHVLYTPVSQTIMLNAQGSTSRSWGVDGHSSPPATPTPNYGQGQREGSRLDSNSEY